MKLHGKVKTLENRYLDLANFYKRELLASGETQTHDSGVNNNKVYDEGIEKGLISELLKEKRDVEQEFQSMVQAKAQLDESEINVDGRVREQERRMIQIENIRNRVSEVLSGFQEEFLEFINSNYQSFTENDVMNLF